MRVYYDTEFRDSGYNIELISIGMIREDGASLYLITDDEDLIDRAARNKWLWNNVVSKLPYTEMNGDWYPDVDHKNFHNIVSREEMKRRVKMFLLGTPDLELWAWYAAYDHVVLAQIFGTMLQLPDGIPMWTNDLRQELHRLGNPRYPEQLEGAHNALEDAKWNRTLGNYLKALDGPVQGPIQSRK